MKKISRNIPNINKNNTSTQEFIYQIVANSICKINFNLYEQVYQCSCFWVLFDQTKALQVVLLVLIHNQLNMSYSVKGQKRYTQKMEKSSKVLLVCVYDTIVFEISNEIIRTKFQKYGKITKLLIFEKGQVTKFFIQFQQIDFAVRAKQQLDGTKLCQSICKMTIYYSNFANVDLKHQTSQAIDYQNYYEFKAVQTYESERQDHTKSSNKDKQIFGEFFQQDDLFKNFSDFNDFQRSKTDNPKTLKQQIAKMNRKTQGGHVIHQQDELDHSIKKSIDHLLGSSFIEQPEPKVQNDKSIKIKQESDVRSPILWFTYRYNLQAKMVYNLYSNFGNISCITIKKQNVYIKFRTKQFAAIASTYLNNTVLAGNVMVLRECPQISDIWKPMEGESCTCTYYDLSFDRFTAQRSITINPPSHTIHVSSIKRETCKQNALRDIFEQFGQVQRVHILQQSNEKNMALVRFRTMQQSFNAIANLHNESFSGRKMQISFTKSKV